jgi:hypothetical protein
MYVLYVSTKHVGVRRYLHALALYRIASTHSTHSIGQDSSATHAAGTFSSTQIHPLPQSGSYPRPDQQRRSD